MTALAQAITRTMGTHIDADTLSADLIFGGIMLVVALFGTAAYGLDLSFGFF
jgi:hypothetical protein